MIGNDLLFQECNLFRDLYYQGWKCQTSTCHLEKTVLESSTHFLFYIGKKFMFCMIGEKFSVSCSTCITIIPVRILVKITTKERDLNKEESTLENKQNRDTQTDWQPDGSTNGWDELTTVKIPERGHQPANSNQFK